MLHQSRLKTCSSLFINMRCVAHAVWVPQVEEYHNLLNLPQFLG